MKHTHENNHNHHHAMLETTQTVRDPVCGMQVDPAKTGHRTVHAGVTYAFCSSGCHEKFTQGPDTYLQPDPAPKVIEGGIYTCPMHPDIETDGTGSCPI